jgi:hypothetical protein
MAPPADRFTSWIDSLGAKWSARLGSWASSFIGAGMEKFFDILGKSAAKKLEPFLSKLDAEGNIPAELKPLFAEMRNPTGEFAAILSSSTAQSVIGGMVERMLAPLWLPLARLINQLDPQVKIGPDLVLQWMLRHPGDFNQMAKRLNQWGFDDIEGAIMFELMHPIFPSDVVGPAALRDPSKFGHYWEDVKKLGLDDKQIELLKEMAYRVPGVQDVIRYVVKEAYNPAIVKEFGQDQEYPAVAEEDARKAGVRPDHLMKEWIAHWNLPGVGQGFDMLHRGIITPAQLTLLLKSLDIMPFWREKLTQMSWSLPGRIEVRMMAQLGLVDKAFIMDILAKDGLAEEYRSIVADMNLVRGIRSDVQLRYQKGWLDSQGVKDELTKSGLSPQIADRLFQWIVANAGPERTAAQKDLTKSEIIKGVKQGVLSDMDAIDQLRQLGYDEAEAVYLLAIEVPQEAQTVSDELRLKVDTIRRQRRQRLISRNQEITSLVQAGVDSALATAYADNDDLRLEKAEVAEEAKETIKNQVEALKVDIDTIRRRRRQRVIDAATELKDLIELGVVDILAAAYVENDDLRLAKEAAGG